MIKTCLEWPESLRGEYQPLTTFWSDFTIAEAFGQEAIKDTYRRASKEWIKDVKYFTELVLVLNHKSWTWYAIANQADSEQWKDIAESNSKLYSMLYYEAHDKALNTFEGDDFRYYFDTTD